MKQTNETWTKNRKELQAHTKKNYPIPNEKAHEIERKKKNTEHTARVWFKRRITKHVFTMVAMSTEIRSINTPWAAAGFFFGVVFFLVSLSLSLSLLNFFFFSNLLFYCCDGRSQPRILILYLCCVDRSHSSPFQETVLRSLQCFRIQC